MKSRNLNYLGQLKMYHIQNYPPTTPVTSIVYNGTEDSIYVAPGPIVHGNRKTPNAWSFVIANRHAGQFTGSHRQTNTTNGQFAENSFSGIYKPIQTGLATQHAALMATADTDAYTKLIEELRGKLDVSVDLAQAGKTAGIGTAVQKSVVQLGRAVRAIKKDPLNATISIAKLTGEMRLIWVYGIKPTMQTVYQAVEESYNRMSRNGVWVKGRASANAIYTGGGSGWPDPGWTWKSEVTDNNGAEYALNVVIPNDSEPVAARWSSLNPVSITWELLPFSFVADWFLNVGDYIRNLESAIVYHRFFRWGYKSVRYSVYCKQNASYVGTSTSGALVDVRNLYYQGTTSLDRGMTRTVLTYFPLPPPIRWNPQLGAGRLLNAAALLSTAIRHPAKPPRRRVLGRNVDVPANWK